MRRYPGTQGRKIIIKEQYVRKGIARLVIIRNEAERQSPMKMEVCSICGAGVRETGYCSSSK
jgi:hypothetical protein